MLRSVTRVARRPRRAQAKPVQRPITRAANPTCVNSLRFLTGTVQCRLYSSKSKSSAKDDKKKKEPKLKESDILRANAVIGDLSSEMTTKYNRFWDYFVSNFERIEAGLQTNEDSDKIYDEIQLQLRKVSMELGAMLLPNSEHNPNSKELVLSADKRLTAFPLVIGMCHVAPKIFFRSKGWSITPFKPRMYPSLTDSVELETLKIYYNEVWVGVSKVLTRNHPPIEEQLEQERMAMGNHAEDNSSDENSEENRYRPNLYKHIAKEAEKKQQVRLVICVRGGALRISSEIEYIVLGMIESVIGEYDMAMHVQEVDFVKDFETEEKAEKISEDEEMFQHEKNEENKGQSELEELFSGESKEDKTREAEMQSRATEYEFYSNMEEKIKKGNFNSKVLPFPLPELAKNFDDMVGKKSVYLEHD